MMYLGIWSKLTCVKFILPVFSLLIWPLCGVFMYSLVLPVSGGSTSSFERKSKPISTMRWTDKLPVFIWHDKYNNWVKNDPQMEFFLPRITTAALESIKNAKIDWSWATESRNHSYHQQKKSPMPSSLVVARTSTVFRALSVLLLLQPLKSWKSFQYSKKRPK